MSAANFEPASPADHRVVGQARAAVRTRLAAAGRADLIDDAELVTSELVTNAVLHARGCKGIEVVPTDAGFRIDVFDGTHLPPIIGYATEHSMTGRGLRLVERVSQAWGVRQTEHGKVVWAEVSAEEKDAPELDEAALLAMWGEDLDEADDRKRVHVVLGEVPTDLLLEAKAHVDNLVREFTLAAAGARSGETAVIPQRLASLIEAVVNRFAEARLAIKHQALDAARRGQDHTRLELTLPFDVADSGEAYLEALDEADGYCRAMRLLTLETPPQHRLFRQWYVCEILAQLRAASLGEQPPTPEPFERRLLEELNTVAQARRAAERAARLYDVASALAGAATPAEVAGAVLTAGVAALGASGGGVLLAGPGGGVEVPATVGYGDEVVARLRGETTESDLPAAFALRTGEAVWIESREERDQRFPALAGLERGTVSMCAVPLTMHHVKPLGALRFSFKEPRLFDHDERLFVSALAAQTAQALERAQLHDDRARLTERLQRSLLPPRLPDVPRAEFATLYHPLGDGIDVGGDFYDVWEIAPGRWGLAIGDVAGTGPEAAALTSLVRHTLRALAMFEDRPRDVLERLNTALCGRPSDEVFDRFCTAIFGVVTVTSNEVRLQLASGGHPYPMVRRASGRIDDVVLGGSILGAFPEVTLATCDMSLARGDLLLLFTDGVLECHRGLDFFDEEGVRLVLRTAGRRAASVAAALEGAVLQHCRGELGDDMCALVVQAL